MALRIPTWSISMCWIRVTSRRCWCRATRAVDSHIFQMDTVVRSNRISSAGDQSWFCTRTPDIVQQDRSGCRTIATRKKKICHRIPSIAHSKPSIWGHSSRKVSSVGKTKISGLLLIHLSLHQIMWYLWVNWREGVLYLFIWDQLHKATKT